MVGAPGFLGRFASTTASSTSDAVEFAGGVRTVSNTSGPWHVERAESFAPSAGVAARVLFDSVELDAMWQVRDFGLDAVAVPDEESTNYARAFGVGP